jgi:hypothetical protein
MDNNATHSSGTLKNITCREKLTGRKALPNNELTDYCGSGNTHLTQRLVLKRHSLKCEIPFVILPIHYTFLKKAG